MLKSSFLQHSAVLDSEAAHLRFFCRSFVKHHKRILQNKQMMVSIFTSSTVFNKMLCSCDFSVFFTYLFIELLQNTKQVSNDMKSWGAFYRRPNILYLTPYASFGSMQCFCNGAQQQGRKDRIACYTLLCSLQQMIGLVKKKSLKKQLIFCNTFCIHWTASLDLIWKNREKTTLQE